MEGPRRTRAAHRPIAALLERQPKTLAKDERFAVLLRCLREEPALRGLRLDRVAFRSLDRARIGPDRLAEFLRVRRLPRSAFFPTFLALKRDYLAASLARRRLREAYIAASLRALPGPVKRLLSALGRVEQALSAASRAPVWAAVVAPRSKKAADACRSRTYADWTATAEAFGRALALRYRRAPNLPWRLFCAASLLGCRLTADSGFKPPSAAEADRAFRRLSRSCHPDAGGDAALFRLLSEARDELRSHAPLASARS